MKAEPAKKADPELVKALAREADQVLESRAFTTAVRALHAQWYGELLNAVDPPRVLELVAKLKALEGIPLMLKHFMTTQDMAARGPNGRRN